MPAKKIETNEKCNYRNGTIIQDIYLSLRCTISQIQIRVYYKVLFPYILFSLHLVYGGPLIFVLIPKFKM